VLFLLILFFLSQQGNFHFVRPGVETLKWKSYDIKVIIYLIHFKERSKEALLIPPRASSNLTKLKRKRESF
jgi:hypothetical protein